MQQGVTALPEANPSYRSYQQTYVEALLPGAAPWDVPGADTYARTPGSKTAVSDHIERRRMEQQRMIDAEYFRDALLQHGRQGESVIIDSHLLDRPKAVSMPVDFDHGTALHVASMRGHTELAQVLLHRRANVNQGNLGGQTALHSASESNQGAIIMELLGAGGDVDQRDKCKQTPLHKAAFSGAEDVIQALLNFGANTRLRDDGGLMPLHKAANMGREGAIGMLLERDPGSVNAEAADGWTALHLAAQGGHAEACESLLAYGADANLGDAGGMTPLHRAATSGSALVCQVLCRGGADAWLKDASRNTPLHIICEDGNAIAARALLELGAPIDAPNGLRRTPLHVAAEGGHLELCGVLVSFGADPASMDSSKGVPSPLAIARRNRNSELVALFSPGQAPAIAM